MLRNKLFNYSIYLNYLSKDKCLFLKSIQNSSRVILANISRLRNIEIERYIYNNFKYKFNEAKSKYVNNIGKFLLGATVISFAQDKISDEEIQEHFEEFFPSVTDTNCIVGEKTDIYDPVRECDNEMIKNQCINLLYQSVESDVEREPSNVSIKSLSKFSNYKLSTGNLEGFIDPSWTQLIDNKTVKLWRRPHPNNSKLFEYRLCGTFDDITARSFFQVQTDIEYRKRWDDLIVDLRVIHTDSETETETIRWVTHYPYPMNDREYIFKKRACQFDDGNSAIIISKSAEGDVEFHEKNSTVRITDYKSIMYIQSHKNFDEAGMDYFLIYYDDPKTNFPNAAVSWMSTAGIPSFMEKVHKASKQLEQEWSRTPRPSPEEYEIPPFEDKQESYQNENNSNRKVNNEASSQFTSAFCAIPQQ